MRPQRSRATKRLLRGSESGDDSPPRFRRAQALSDELFAGAEAAEGMAAFAERRPPSWQQR